MWFSKCWRLRVSACALSLIGVELGARALSLISVEVTRGVGTDYNGECCAASALRRVRWLRGQCCERGVANAGLRVRDNECRRLRVSACALSLIGVELKARALCCGKCDGCEVSVVGLRVRCSECWRLWVSACAFSLIGVELEARALCCGRCDGCECSVANEVLRVLVCEYGVANAGDCGSLLAHFLRLALSLVLALFVSARGLSVSGMSVASERGMVVGDGPV